MLFASSGSFQPKEPRTDDPHRVHAVLVFTPGGIDFDCPHVDARTNERPLYYDEEPLSIWVLAGDGKERLELGGLCDLAGSEVERWPVLEQEIYLSDMLKHDDASLNVMDLYRLSLREAVQREVGGKFTPGAFRICCTRDFLVLDVRRPDGRPLRPRLGDLRCGLDTVATKLGDSDLVLPVFDRGAGAARSNDSKSFLGHCSINIQMHALLKVVTAPREILIDPPSWPAPWKVVPPEVGFRA